jgi:hypothetical protein
MVIAEQHTHIRHSHVFLQYPPLPPPVLYLWTSWGRILPGFGCPNASICIATLALRCLTSCLYWPADKFAYCDDNEVLMNSFSRPRSWPAALAIPGYDELANKLYKFFMWVPRPTVFNMHMDKNAMQYT